jgi:hypothetical protein
VFLNARHVRTEPVAAPGTIVPPVISLQNNNTIDGATLNWNYNITPRATLNASLDWQRTQALAPIEGSSNSGSVQANLSTSLTPRTSLYGGTRYQVWRSTPGVNDKMQEFAVFAGVSHFFR